MEEAISQAEQTLTEHERMASLRDRHSSWSSYYAQAASRLRTPWDSRSSASSTSSSSSSSSSSGPYVPEMSFLHMYPVLFNHEEPSRRREYPRLSLFRILDELPATKSEEAHASPHPGGLRGGSSDSMTGYSDVRPMPRDTGSVFTRGSDCGDYDQPSHYDRFDSDHSHDSRPASNSNSHRSLLYPQQRGPATTPNVQQQQQQQIEGRTSGKSRAERRAMTPGERRKARTCIVDGCANYIVHRHRCFRHGGGKRCSVDGCRTSAKQRGLCWRHGGSILCKVDGCKRGVKTRGLCWTHQDVQADNNQELQDASNAPAHCIFDGCSRAPILSSFYEVHSREVSRPGYIFEL